MLTRAPQRNYLDRVSLDIVEMLTEDPRITYQVVANRTGLSRTAVRERIRHLLASGTVGITGVMHPAACGLPVLADLLIIGQIEPDRLAALLDGHPGVQTATAAGMTCLRLRMRDDERLAELTEQLRATGVSSVRCWRAVRLLREPLRPVEWTPTKLDEVDHRLIGLLIEQPRAFFSQLSTEIGLSQAATRARAVRLLSSGTIAFEVTVHTGPIPLTSRIQVSVHGRPLAQAARHLEQINGLTHLAIGHSTILAYLSAPTPHSQHIAYQQIRSAPGVTDMEVLPLAAPLKLYEPAQPQSTETTTS